MPVLTNTAPKKATATKKQVDVTREIVLQETRYVLELNEYEAGYLIDLLYGHVAGEVNGHVLLPIAGALQDAGALRLRATNTNRPSFDRYQNRHAVLDFVSDAARKAAGAPPKDEDDF